MSRPAVASRIEDYALIGDTHTAALVSRDGSVDWLCLPRFDSGAVFAALLGDERHGRWLLAPAEDVLRVRRRYRDGTLVLETEFDSASGTVRLIDFMPHRHRHADLVRIVEGVRGRVPMRMQLVMRFDHGWIVPWVRRVGSALLAVAGPDALTLRTPVEARGEEPTTVARFAVPAGTRVPFTLSWHPSTAGPSAAGDPERLLSQAESWWRAWIDRCTYEGRCTPDVQRSLITLKALTYEPTGGMVAAPTTSLPEQLGGVRNSDYRYVWLRDATFTLYALLLGGYTEEAEAWRDWLLRAVAGDPAQLQIVYGLAGERRLPEQELGWLPGYEGSRPVRVGNAAFRQFQLDVYGEVMDAFHLTRRAGIPPDPYALGPPTGPDGVPGGPLARPGRWHLGDSGAPAALHAFQGDGLGGGGPGRQGRGAVRPRGPGRPLAGPASGDPRRGVPAGLRRRAERVHPVLRLEGPGREPPHDPPRGVPPARR